MLPPSSACPLAEELRAASLLPSWPHLGAVYDVLLAAFAAANANKSLRAHADRRFLTALLALFASDSEDPRAPSCAAPWPTPSSVRQHDLLAALLLRGRQRRRCRLGAGGLRKHYQRFRGAAQGGAPGTTGS
ncbi:uncharacterized protein [Lolium perenne]|uniref:uncharacterized protein n=1 Tax=Lolium perenne TaxID=4522 RepID=UPI0021F67A1A|nr:uncharacterized protein LOC127314158 isoform X3 [Lolium perenne]